MSENITQYIDFIQGFDNSTACVIQSDTISVEGSTNSFVSSEPDFGCLSKGDYFIVWGTDYNDGIYEKDNLTDLFRIEAKAPLDHSPISLTTENCHGSVVIIQKAEIGQASGLLNNFHVWGHGIPGVIGQGDLTFPSLSSSATATSGVVGITALQPLELNATGYYSTDAWLNLESITAESTGVSGYVGVCSLQELSVHGLAHGSSAYASVGLPALWGYNEDIFWGSANIELPAIIGGDFANAEVEIFLQVDAQVYARLNAEIFITGLDVFGYSIGTWAYAVLPTHGVEASGCTGAKVMATLPAFDATAQRGAWGRNLLPSFTAYGMDSALTEDQHGNASVTLPLFAPYGNRTQIDIDANIQLPDFEMEARTGTILQYQYTMINLPAPKGQGRVGARGSFNLGAFIGSSTSKHGVVGSASVRI